ncbi:sex hormone-binding globulin [Carettochelys insculpta]|uniref:sex hormone-binding globulin n=1 Tax=Carettochelys insculpta TaxID=44489 RepID=UPI003EC0C532
MGNPHLSLRCAHVWGTLPPVDSAPPGPKPNPSPDAMGFPAALLLLLAWGQLAAWAGPDPTGPAEISTHTSHYGQIIYTDSEELLKNWPRRKGKPLSGQLGYCQQWVPHLVPAGEREDPKSHLFLSPPPPQEDPCFQVLPAEEETLNIGQYWGGVTPTATLEIDLSRVTSADSSFELRTLDPEGVIFFGDLGDSSDWFLLGLRRGRAEIQLFNNLTTVVVRGGQRLDDGRWHKLRVRNEGNSVLLEADGAELLALSHVLQPITQRAAPHMRIAVGGHLLPAPQLLSPLDAALDGCMRRWVWLNQSTTWQQGPPLGGSSKPCFPHLRPGSFFPGAGLASFPLAELANNCAPLNGSWELEVKMGLRAPRQTGLLLAVEGLYRSLALSLVLHPTDMRVRLGNRTELRLTLPEGPCLDAPLSLQVSPSHLALRLGTHQGSLPSQPPDFQALWAAWLDRGTRLFIGGLPEGPETPSPPEWGPFRGCLRGIRVQGHPLDLDEALFRNDTIWAHSCPGEGAGGGS